MISRNHAEAECIYRAQPWNEIDVLALTEGEVSEYCELVGLFFQHVQNFDVLNDATMNALFSVISEGSFRAKIGALRTYAVILERLEDAVVVNLVVAFPGLLAACVGLIPSKDLSLFPELAGVLRLLIEAYYRADRGQEVQEIFDDEEIREALEEYCDGEDLEVAIAARGIWSLLSNE
jgi:hypothetical protein